MLWYFNLSSSPESKFVFVIVAVGRKLTHSMWPLQPFVDIQHDIQWLAIAAVLAVRLWSEARNPLRYIQRIDEMERIIRFLLEELTKARISVCRLQRLITIHFRIKSYL